MSQCFAKSNSKPDGVYLTVEGGVSRRGFGASGGIGVIYDIKRDNVYGYGVFEGGTDPASVFSAGSDRGISASAGFMWNTDPVRGFEANFGGLTATWPMGFAQSLIAIYRPEPIYKKSFWGLMDDASRYALLNQKLGFQFGSANLLGEGPTFGGITTGGSFSTSFLNWNLGGRLSDSFSRDAERSIKSILSNINEPTVNELRNGISRFQKIWR